MPTASRRKSVSVVKRLSEAPQHYSFQQTVRLLERAAVFAKQQHINTGANPVARFVPPTSEAMRFYSNQSLKFPTSEIDRVILTQNVNGRNQWRVNTNFMGLTGSMGVLPYHYTELILQRLKIKDETLKQFFDLFNHRTVSLFYQASTKYRLPLEYERTKLNPSPAAGKPTHNQALMSLIGLGTAGLQKRNHTHDEALIFFGGLLSQQVRSASGLRQILQHHFKVPVQIREFRGQWQDLIDDVRTRLPGFEVPQGQNNCLGRSAMLGRKGWFAQGKISVIIGPLNGEQLKIFAPGTKSLKSMNEIIRLYLGLEHDYEFKIQIKKSDLPKQVPLSAADQRILGWNTWLSGSGNTPQVSNDDTVEISLSRDGAQ